MNLNIKKSKKLIKFLIAIATIAFFTVMLNAGWEYGKKNSAQSVSSSQN